MRAFRRWLLRFLALAALAGVGYGVYVIVRDGTDDAIGTRGPIQPALEKLASRQEQLGARLEVLRPGVSGGQAQTALRATQRAHEAAVRVFRERRSLAEPIPGETELNTALGAEFDYLDALRSVLSNRRSPLLGDLGDRAQEALDAFSALPESAGMEAGIRGTQAFVEWARARR